MIGYLGLGAFVLFIFAIFLFGIIGYGLSFVKNKWVSSIAFYFFAAVNILFSWVYAYEYQLDSFNGANMEQVFRANAPIVCCLLTLTACVLWPRERKPLARLLGLVSIGILFLLVFQ